MGLKAEKSGSDLIRDSQKKHKLFIQVYKFNRDVLFRKKTCFAWI